MKKLAFIAIVTILASCVPMKKFQELEAGYNKCKEENEGFKTKIQDLEGRLDNLQVSNEEIEAQLAQLIKDTTRLGQELRRNQQTYKKLATSYDLLSDNKNKILSENAKETRELIEQLEATQLSLQKREDELKLKEENLSKLTQELSMRAARVKELESMLARKDSAVSAIKKRVQDALLGFENKGLSIEQKNGKVYVSLDESLLFALGKYNVDTKGVEVLKKLGAVLEQNPDINITVEGHTDNIPYKGSGDIQDNWDLSVRRATAVTKIILNSSKIDPTRITAAGRGEYIPLDESNSPEGRQKNRRTEIILAPKLDELYQFLNEG